MPLKSDHLPVITNLPDRNPFFTGREELLESLRDRLIKEDKATIIQKDQNKGCGIGKSEIAIEYSFRYHSASL